MPGKYLNGEWIEQTEAEAAADAVVLPPPNMPALRQAAFNTAMAYGNGVTAKITSEYADAESRSWTQQALEAEAVIAGEAKRAEDIATAPAGTPEPEPFALPDGAMLPLLAIDKGVSLLEYARSVKTNADNFKLIAVAAVRLRRGAEQLLNPALDTPEKLNAAFEQLRAALLHAANQFGIPVEQPAPAAVAPALDPEPAVEPEPVTELQPVPDPEPAPPTDAPAEPATEE